MINQLATVHQFANEVRRRALENYGEKEVTRLFLAFKKKVDRETGLLDGLEAVVNFMVRIDDPKIFQLGFVYMDSIGGGSALVEDVTAEIAQLRLERERAGGRIED
jgi:hypothetical protein